MFEDEVSVSLLFRDSLSTPILQTVARSPLPWGNNPYQRRRHAEAGPCSAASTSNFVPTTQARKTTPPSRPHCTTPPPLAPPRTPPPSRATGHPGSTPTRTRQRWRRRPERGATSAIAPRAGSAAGTGPPPARARAPAVVAGTGIPPGATAGVEIVRATGGNGQTTTWVCWGLGSDQWGFCDLSLSLSSKKRMVGKNSLLQPTSFEYICGDQVPRLQPRARGDEDA